MKREEAVKVVAGLICRKGRVLAGQRRKDGPFPGKWEFPGGKVQEGERRTAALQRELKEELGISVISAAEVFRHSHRYPQEFSVDLIFFRVDEYEGTVRNFVFERLAWVSLEELKNLDFLEGDRPLIEKMAQGEIDGCG